MPKVSITVSELEVKRGIRTANIRSRNVRNWHLEQIKRGLPFTWIKTGPEQEASFYEISFNGIYYTASIEFVTQP